MKIIVDKNTNKVLFAESDETFVDILFSLLTLPLGVICRLGRRRSKADETLECMENLFTSLVGLDPKYFKNPELKVILSFPKRSFQSRYWSLVRSEPSRSRKYCLCGKPSLMQKNKVCTDSRLSACNCGIPNYCRCESCPKVDEKEENRNGLLFVRTRGEFVVTDDLRIVPVYGAASVMSALKDVTVRLTNNVEEVLVQEKDQVLNLLMCSLVSSSPLSDVFCPARKEEAAKVVERHQRRTERTRPSFEEPILEVEEEEEEDDDDEDECEIQEEEEEKLQSPPEKGGILQPQGIPIKLIMDVTRRKVLFAEAGEDFVDLLFNFLTYPLGALAALPGGHPLACFGNLCGSVRELDVKRYFKSERCKQMLLSPDLPHQIFENLLKGPASETSSETSSSASSGASGSGKSLSSLWFRGRSGGGAAAGDSGAAAGRESSVKKGVLKDCSVFMVTDGLVVSPLTSMSVVSAMDEFNCYPRDLKEVKVVVDVDKARDLLLAALTSRTPLTRTFLSGQKKWNQFRWMK